MRNLSICLVATAFVGSSAFSEEIPPSAERPGPVGGSPAIYSRPDGGCGSQGGTGSSSGYGGIGGAGGRGGDADGPFIYCDDGGQRGKKKSDKGSKTSNKRRSKRSTSF